jgi:hypothetical protein
VALGKNSQLDAVLHVKTKDCLRHLCLRERLACEDFDGRHLYCSVDAARRRIQVAARRARTSAPVIPSVGPVSEEMKATIILFLGLLDEKQRRLFAGLESLQLGRGGDLLVAELLGLDPETVAKGRQELLDETPDSGRVRKPGGGRKAVEKKRRRSSRASRSS